MSDKHLRSIIAYNQILGTKIALALVKGEIAPGDLAVVTEPVEDGTPLFSIGPLFVVLRTSDDEKAQRWIQEAFDARNKACEVAKV